MVTGTPCTWTPLMLMVCTACVAGVSCGVFSASMPPAGAILASVLSFLPPAAVLLLAATAGAGCDTVVVTTGLVGVVAVVTASWSWMDCHSPDAVLKRI